MMCLKIFLLTALFVLCLSIKLPNRGDIIRYRRICNFYNHYAVYVGNEAMNGKKPEQNTFELTKIGRKTNCVYGKLEQEHEVFNYLDNEVNPKSWAEMKTDIENMHMNCNRWTPLNTCEHIATKIRYGEGHTHCQQLNTWMELFCKKLDNFRNKGKNSGRRKRSPKLLNPAAAAA